MANNQFQKKDFPMTTTTFKTHALSKTALEKGMAILLACSLSACGGGGGVGGSGAGVTPTNSPSGSSTGNTENAPIASTISAANVVPTYTGEELAAYNTVSLARTSCGFGGVNQNASLDAATLNHNAYMAQNYQFGHYETLGLAGYTGNQPYQRGVAAGYPSALTHYGEVLSMATNIPKAGFGLLGARRLLAAPYHLMGIMGVDREVGVSVRSAGQTGSGADYIETNPSWAPSVYLSIDFASQPSMPAQHQSSTDVLTYPCAGVTGTVVELTAETPSPIPARNLVTSPIGQPVFVQVLAGQTLVITSASVIGPTGAVALLNLPLLDVPLSRSIMRPSIAVPRASFSQTASD
jgi:hypothetical protein